MGDKSIPNRGWSGTGRKENVNGKQILTEDKLKSTNEPKDKLKTVKKLNLVKLNKNLFLKIKDLKD